MSQPRDPVLADQAEDHVHQSVGDGLSSSLLCLGQLPASRVSSLLD